MNKHQNPDGTYDGVGVMSDLTGLSRQSIVDIAAEAKANHARLYSCAYHEFEPIQQSKPMRQRYRCKHCGGEVDSNAYHWHEQGRRKP